MLRFKVHQEGHMPRTMLANCARRSQISCHAYKGSSSSIEGWSSNGAGVASIKVELRKLLLDLADRHGPVAALLPGLQEDKARVDELLRQLQQNADVFKARMESSEALDAQPRSLDGRVPGEWELVYASNGTVVTRTPLAHYPSLCARSIKVVTRTPLVQALVAISRSLPGAGISNIKQELRTDKQGVLIATNEAVLGLGPLGSWKLGIEGKWISRGDGRTSRVVFDQIQVKPVGILGMSLPDWLPQAAFGTGSSEDPRAGADWETTYVDEDMRLGVGRPSGNTFLFFRRNHNT